MTPPTADAEIRRIPFAGGVALIPWDARTRPVIVLASLTFDDGAFCVSRLDTQKAMFIDPVPIAPSKALAEYVCTVLYAKDPS